jgi:hypothetical protein
MAVDLLSRPRICPATAPITAPVPALFCWGVMSVVAQPVKKTVAARAAKPKRVHGVLEMIMVAPVDKNECTLI